MIELNRSYPTARKEHKCMFCGGVINVGDKYERQTNIYDGQIYDWVCHLECQKITGLLNMFDYCNDEGITTECFQESICEWLYDHHYNDESDTYDEAFDPDVMSYHEIVLNIIKELESKQ
jgi:hypothetical protein